MPHKDNLQTDFNNEPESNHLQKSSSLSRELDNLQNGIRVDFDQKINELSSLLQRFKALVVSPNSKAANEPTAVPTAQQAFQTGGPKEGADPKIALGPKGNFHNTNIQVTKKIDLRSIDLQKSEVLEEAPSSPPILTKHAVTSAAESARFETGLYKLNSQLYRFRLELDQEMEFREEPLHVHFNQESDFSQLLQKISDRSIEKNSDNNRH